MLAVGAGVLTYYRGLPLYASATCWGGGGALIALSALLKRERRVIPYRPFEHVPPELTLQIMSFFPHDDLSRVCQADRSFQDLGDDRQLHVELSLDGDDRAEDFEKQQRAGHCQYLHTALVSASSCFTPIFCNNLHKMRNVRVLELTGLSSESALMTSFSTALGEAHFPKLEVLTLRCPADQAHGDVALDHLGRCPALKELYLDAFDFGVEEACTTLAAGIRGCTSLMSLSIYSGNLNWNSAATILEAAETCPMLTAVVFYRHKFVDDDEACARFMAALSSLTNLTMLSLRDCMISDEEARALDVACVPLTRLVDLDLAEGENEFI